MRRLIKPVRLFFRLLRLAFATLQENDPIRMAGATAFFSFFALPPIVIILSNLLSKLFNDRYQRVSGQLFTELSELFGARSANQLKDISHRLQQPKPDWFFTALSIVLLLIASTTLFAIIKNSLNQLWNVRRKHDGSVLPVVGDKLIALAIIIGTGLLFSAFLTVEQFSVQLSSTWSLPSFAYYRPLVSAGNIFVSIVVRMVWFALILKFLPDVRIPWRVIGPGALFTSILFKIGEIALNHLLIQSAIGPLYGRAGAIILLLLFVFYSSLIFYYGAAFTRQYSEWIHAEAQPGKHATNYVITEVDTPEQKTET